MLSSSDWQLNKKTCGSTDLFFAFVDVGHGVFHPVVGLRPIGKRRIDGAPVIAAERVRKTQHQIFFLATLGRFERLREDSFPIAVIDMVIR